MALAVAGCGQARTPAPALSDRAVRQGGVHAQVRGALQAEFALWDRDGDGRVTRHEMPHLPAARFVALDADRDGSLRLAEGVSAEGERLMAAHLTRLPAVTGDVSAAGWFDFLKRRPAPASPAGKRPILLVPGYFEPGAMWYSFKGELQRRGWTQIYIYEHWPGLGDIRDMAAKAGALADKIRAETGFDRIDVVGHSMGGLVLRYWIQRMGGADKIAHYVSFATPHRGTVAGYFGPGESARQMRPGSSFLTDLNGGDSRPGDAHYASLWSRTDEIVVPQPHGEYQGASDMAFPLSEHLQLAWLQAPQDRAIEELSK
ncbi:MAG: hypothetical protein FJZ01_10580 [Candidatus Sericytochromatia bacterium]|nr:hypothetical protein [Candidatus Tanganyikabacteria bacterium]